MKASYLQVDWWSHWTERNWTTLWTILYVFMFYSLH